MCEVVGSQVKVAVSTLCLVGSLGYALKQNVWRRTSSCCMFLSLLQKYLAVLCIRLVAVCMAMPVRPLEHISCCVFVWVATACLVLWAGVLGFRDISDTVRCAVRELGMRNIWFLSVLLQVIFAHGSSTSSGMAVQCCHS
jgi:hypothetical protein